MIGRFLDWAFLGLLNLIFAVQNPNEVQEIAAGEDKILDREYASINAAEIEFLGRTEGDC